MHVRNDVNSKSIGFGNKVIIKSKTTTVLNDLGALDNEWSTSRNPRFRYAHLSGLKDDSGFYSGLLTDKAEKSALQGLDRLMKANIKKGFTPVKEGGIFSDLVEVIESTAKSIEVNTTNKLQELLQLTSIDEMIQRFAK